MSLEDNLQPHILCSKALTSLPRENIQLFEFVFHIMSSMNSSLALAGELLVSKYGPHLQGIFVIYWNSLHLVLIGNLILEIMRKL